MLSLVKPRSPGEPVTPATLASLFPKRIFLHVCRDELKLSISKHNPASSPPKRRCEHDQGGLPHRPEQRQPPGSLASRMGTWPILMVRGVGVALGVNPTLLYDSLN